jgi:Tfp pilus assembly protein PilP
MTLTGDAAKEYMRQVAERAQKKREELLSAAKAEAARRGKEPFDLAKLETMCDTSREGKMDPVETRRARFEEMYYTSYPDVMTLEEFAGKVTELNRW